MAVYDVIAATDFYGKKLGLSYVENEAHGLWRYFETQRTTFELFHAHPDRIRVNHSLTCHEDWLGMDIILADVDGNPIQVVQYGRMNDN